MCVVFKNMNTLHQNMTGKKANTLIFALLYCKDYRVKSECQTKICSLLTKHGRIPENVHRLHIIADNCGYPQVRKSKILIFTNIRKCSETYVKNLKICKVSRNFADIYMCGNPDSLKSGNLA